MSPTEKGGPSMEEMGIEQLETETKKLARLTRDEVEARLAVKENLENFDLSELRITGV